MAVGRGRGWGGEVARQQRALQIQAMGEGGPQGTTMYGALCYEILKRISEFAEQMVTADCCARCVNEASQWHSWSYQGYSVKARQEPQVKTWKLRPHICMTKGQDLGLRQAPPPSAGHVTPLFVLFFSLFVSLSERLGDPLSACN